MVVNLMRLLAEKQEANEPFATVTIISSTADNFGAGKMMAVDKNGQILGGSLGDGVLQENARLEAKICITRGLSRKAQISLENGEAEVFINSFCHGDKLIIAGSGTVALYVYKFAQTLGYNISIIDNRSETLTRERFPEASEIILGDIVEELSKYEITEDTSIVIVSHHHESDEPALHTVITSPARYIGVLGNKRKVHAYYNNLNSMGISEELIARVHMPVGLDLGGTKTAEIALAVIAEIQAVKYKRPGGFITVNNRKGGIGKSEELF